MTLPRDVAEAVELGDQFAGTYEHGFAVKNAWDRIRAHLLSQDAEIHRLRSRLAAADALLRECDAVARKRGDKYGLCDAIDNDGQPYQSASLAAHLQGAGDDIHD